MEIKLQVKHESSVMLIITSGNATIIDDLATTKKDRWVVPETSIEQFITVANKCSRFNEVSDIDFVKKIFDSFLSDYEKQQLIEILKIQNP